MGNARLVRSLETPGIFDSDTIRISVDGDVIRPDYVELLLNDASYISTQIELTQRGAILPGMNSRTVSELVVLLPSLDMQGQLMTYLRSSLSHINAQVYSCDHAIALLTERRTALISAAVTGKIDVRHLAEDAA